MKRATPTLLAGAVAAITLAAGFTFADIAAAKAGGHGTNGGGISTNNAFYASLSRGNGRVDSRGRSIYRADGTPRSNRSITTSGRAHRTSHRKRFISP